MKDVRNLIFYRTLENGVLVDKTHAFYKDGSVEELSNKQDIDSAISSILAEEKMSNNTSLSLEERINNRIKAVSASDFIKNYNTYKYVDSRDTKVILDNINNNLDKINNSLDSKTDVNESVDHTYLNKNVSYQPEFDDKKDNRVVAGIKTAAKKVRKSKLARNLLITGTAFVVSC